jgi:type IV pilus assembly protein PilA
MVNTLRLKLKEPKGFTLIKLLAVIVLLEVIPSIVILASSNVINKSNDKASTSGNYSYDLGGVHLSIPSNLSSISEQDLITAVQ